MRLPGVFGGVVLLVTAACEAPGESAGSAAIAAERARFTGEELARVFTLSPLPEVPPDPTNRVADDPRAARLGQFLFFDEALSANGAVSCATCHQPDKGFSDGLPVGEGIGTVDRHSITIWNSAYQRWLFWDGRADSLWAQATMPIETELEHGFTRLELAHRIHRDDRLRRAYEDLFGPMPDLSDGDRFPPRGRPVAVDLLAQLEAEREAARRAGQGGHWHGQGVTVPPHPDAVPWNGMAPEDQHAVTEVFANSGKAIAAYERRIVSRRAPFDVYVEGLREGDGKKLDALSESARRGLALFVGEARCHLCHHGPLLSDREFHSVSIPPRAGGPLYDPGRMAGIEAVRVHELNAVGPFSDAPDGEARRKIESLPSHAHGWGEFRTPSLRNVAVTAPYFHQGQLATLEEVVHFYSTREGAVTDPPPAERILIPLNLTSSQEGDLVAFLESLTDEDIDPALRSAPASPLLEPTR